MAAQRLVHTYVSMAGFAACVILPGFSTHPKSTWWLTVRRSCRHQLGLHKADKALYLPETVRITSQHVYNTIRMFDTYVTCSLGLPRVLRADRVSKSPKDAPHIAPIHMVHASFANTELLEIMGSAMERIYFNDAVVEVEDTTQSELGEWGDISEDLLQWDAKWPIFAQFSDRDVAKGTKLCTK
jgi:hypothetical protein